MTKMLSFRPDRSFSAASSASTLEFVHSRHDGAVGRARSPGWFEEGSVFVGQPLRKPVLQAEPIVAP